MDAGKFQLVKEADFVLSKCGRLLPPIGSVVYIGKSFLVQAALTVGSVQSFYKEITGDTVWCWRSISTALSGSPSALFAQVLRPDGKYLFNGLIDLTLIAGYGSSRYLLSNEIECPIGSKIQFSFDTQLGQAAATQPVSVLCEGAYAYYLKDGNRSRCVEQEASDMPRVFSGSNQNLMAPCWMQGEGPKTPDGFEDEKFTYGNGTTNVASVTIGGVLSTKASIQIDNDNDFIMNRLLFDVRPAAGVTAGSFLCRIRAGSGYVLTDDYLDVAKYLGSSYLAKGWEVQRGDQIQFDLTLVDGAGSGAIAIEVFADGVKRRRAA